MSSEQLKEMVKNYWEDRARESGGDRTATTNDVYLRELEVSTLTSQLQDLGLSYGATVLDVGCGDGYTTMRIAQNLPTLRFRGVDYSQNMIANAVAGLESKEASLRERISFRVADVLQLDKELGDSRYDAAITDRCLINLGSYEEQAKAIAQIAAHLKPGACYLAIENFLEGQDNMNRARAGVDLPPIPVRWHNLYFREAEFRRAAEPFFSDVVMHEFSSSYYFATRVIYSAMCKMRGEEPDYEHEIHRLAVHLPWSGQFSPIRLAVLRRRS